MLLSLCPQTRCRGPPDRGDSREPLPIRGFSCKLRMASNEPRCTAPIRHRSRGFALPIDPTKPAAVASCPDPRVRKASPSPVLRPSCGSAQGGITPGLAFWALLSEEHVELGVAPRSVRLTRRRRPDRLGLAYSSHPGSPAIAHASIPCVKSILLAPAAGKGGRYEQEGTARMREQELLDGISSRGVSTPRLSTHLLESRPEDGPPVLFVHGNVASSRFFEETPASFPPYYRGLAPTCGASAGPSPDRNIAT
jgi:hypothetical protein